MMSGPRKRPYDWLDAFRWMIDVAEGLSYLHERDPLTIHRDVKPENILLTSRERKQSRAKITDFGLAKLVQLDPTEGPMTRCLAISRTQRRFPRAVCSVLARAPACSAAVLLHDTPFSYGLPDHAQACDAPPGPPAGS